MMCIQLQCRVHKTEIHRLWLRVNVHVYYYKSIYYLNLHFNLQVVSLTNKTYPWPQMVHINVNKSPES